MPEHKNKKARQKSEHKISVFPVEPAEHDSKKKAIMTLIIVILMIIIFCGWIWSLKFSFNQREITDEELAKEKQWELLKGEIDDSFASIKKNLAKIKNSLDVQEKAANLNQTEIERLKDSLNKEMINNWITYSNFDYNFSIKYPATWQQETREGKITFSENGKEMATIIIAPEIARPKVADDKIKIFFLDNTEARLYTDANTNTVIAALPEGKNDIAISGSGATTEQMASTFKFIK
ncbi:MAG: hypothetical protein WC310_05010 [Patescibacteria group bacterium]|jgi:ABC-type maltose transport system permease subunit